jgi:hypothetical protein
MPVWPSLQLRQRPQAMLKGTETRSPTLMNSTSRLASITSPVISCGRMQDLREELEAATAALREQLASWPYAFAMAGGSHGGAEHPALCAVRDEVDRMRARCRDLEARIAEHA